MRHSICDETLAYQRMMTYIQALHDFPDFRYEKELLTAGVLTPVGRTRARFCTVGPAFPDAALETARTPVTLVDPYER
ncbi:hypothetical protein GCM10011609_60150 [Lentzea pudingi]|uniref:Uncharacterized protein n=1 Tax=Lentzea pudingi TaxID=1789439 RepID=A0ABQ2IL04_9PSEU|nr:hypothetical protein [Lentzea pudingi]GGN11951.1 hypothetical protein GCM10011609_60150 [Lentzea pudingi]